jgi:hypothetical protein
VQAVINRAAATGADVRWPGRYRLAADGLLALANAAARRERAAVVSIDAGGSVAVAVLHITSKE